MANSIKLFIAVLLGFSPLSAFALPTTGDSLAATSIDPLAYPTPSSVILRADSPVVWFNPFPDSPLVWFDPFLDSPLPPTLGTPILNIDPIGFNPIFIAQPPLSIAQPPSSISPFLFFTLPPDDINYAFFSANGSISGSFLGSFVVNRDFNLFTSPFLSRPPCCGSFFFSGTPTPPTSNVPEPSSIALFGIGIAGLRVFQRINKQQRTR